MVVLFCFFSLWLHFYRDCSNAVFVNNDSVFSLLSKCCLCYTHEFVIQFFVERDVLVLFQENKITIFIWIMIKRKKKSHTIFDFGQYVGIISSFKKVCPYFDTLFNILYNNNGYKLQVNIHPIQCSFCFMSYKISHYYFGEKLLQTIVCVCE